MESHAFPCAAPVAAFPGSCSAMPAVRWMLLLDLDSTPPDLRCLNNSARLPVQLLPSQSQAGTTAHGEDSDPSSATVPAGARVVIPHHTKSRVVTGAARCQGRAAGGFGRIEGGRVEKARSRCQDSVLGRGGTRVQNLENLLTPDTGDPLPPDGTCKPAQVIMTEYSVNPQSIKTWAELTRRRARRNACPLTSCFSWNGRKVVAVARVVILRYSGAPCLRNLSGVDSLTS